MKRAISFLTVAMLTLSLAGCSLTAETTHDYGTDYTTAERTTSTTVYEEPDVWELNYYVDEFDSPTNEWYVANKSYFVGSFSNSATTDSLLYVYMLFDADDIGFILYEYGSNQAKNSYSRRNEYGIVMKDTNGYKYELDGFFPAESDRLFVDSSDLQTIYDAFEQDGTISFYIYDKDRTIESYLFSVETSNFSEVIR